MQKFLTCLAVLSLIAMGPQAAEAQVSEDNRPVLVTIDDLPLVGQHKNASAEFRLEITEKLLKVLADHEIRAVGLVTWHLVRTPEDRDLLQRWLDAGHELGNHSHDHRSLHTMEAEEFIADVEKARVPLSEFLEERGKSLRFFRFPLLHEGDTLDKLLAVRKYLASTGQRNLPVTLDNNDWQYEGAWVEAWGRQDKADMKRFGEEYQRSLRLSIAHHEATGDALLRRPVAQVLLLHANIVGAAQWDDLFRWMKGRGYRFASVDEVLPYSEFAKPHAHVGPRGLGLWDRLRVEKGRTDACQAVTQALQTQAAAWNRGDLEAFTAVYDVNAAFVSTTGLTRGRQHVLERYQERYPDRQAMGNLSLLVQECRPFWGIETSMVGDAQPGSVHSVSVVARWSLAYGAEAGRSNAEGLTLLVFERQGDVWRIVHDASM